MNSLWSSGQDAHGNWLVFRDDDAQAIAANESIANCLVKCMQFFEDNTEVKQLKEQTKILPFRRN